MYFEIYQEKSTLLQSWLPSDANVSKGQWRWRLKSNNHEIIASGESYHNKQDCLHVVDLIKGTNSDTKIIYK